MDRDAYVKKMKAKLDEWNAEIDKIQAKAKAAQADNEAKYKEQLSELRAQRDKAQEKMKEAQAAGDAAWDDMQKSMETAWASISDGFNKAWNRF